MQHKICFLDADTFGNFFKFSKPAITCEWIEHANTSQDQIIERIKNCTIVIVNKVKLSQVVLQEAKNLQFIALVATGYNNIDLEYCRKNNILVSNIRNYATDSLCEHVFALILSLRKNLLGYQKAVQNGVWEKDDKFCFFLDPIHCLANTRLAIIGKGNLGNQIAKIAKSFGMEVVFVERKVAKKIRPSYISFEEAIKTSQVISIHCPLLPETKNLITKTEINKMQPNCLLINTARGGIINEKDLVDAIINKKIAGAGIDVVSKEPPGFSHPYYRILHYPNFILTPHTAWIGLSAMKRAWQQAIENIENFAKGKPSQVL